MALWKPTRKLLRLPYLTKTETRFHSNSSGRRRLCCSSIPKPRLRDEPSRRAGSGLVILGISADPPKAQLKFKEKEDLPYTLLADETKEIAKKYNVLKEKNMYGKKVIGIARTTFLIGPDGKIIHVFEAVKPEGHADEVLAYVKGAVKK